MTSPLDVLCRPNGSLAAEPPNATEFARLCAAAGCSLADARVDGISLEGRLMMAYRAAHAFCTAELRYHGYRPQNRYIIFQALPHTLELRPEVWKILSHAHNRRNTGENEGALEISEQFVRDVIKACEVVAESVRALPPLRSSA
ncbi:MAG: hypothetical protein ACREVI_07165 [Steroidobacteraceae bacterium]